jgi:myxalamid-type polyketide synthase MxaE and MxaD
MHIAGTLDNRLLLNLDLQALTAVLRPKVVGGWLLHRLVGEVDFFVLFSSLGSLVVQRGQANYAAANASLDALAHYRAGQGQAALSVNWGVWEQLGLVSTDEMQRNVRQMEREGVYSFTPAQGLEALGQLMRQGAAQVVVAPIDWAQFGDARAHARERPILSPLFVEASPASESGRQVESSQQQDGIRERLLGAEPAQRRTMMEGYLREQVGKVLRLASSRIDRHRPLGSLGLDSLMGVELRNRLENDLDLALSATLVWNYPTLAELALYLADKLGVSLQAEQPGEAKRVDAAAKAAGEERLGDLIADVESLSDEEALRLLQGGKR